MEDYVKYIVMYNSALRDGEETVIEFFDDEEEAKDYVKKNPVFKSFFSWVPDSETYVVKAVTSYRRLT